MTFVRSGAPVRGCVRCSPALARRSVQPGFESMPDSDDGLRQRDRRVRFVVRDSVGHCFLQVVPWGEAGLNFRTTRLNLAEAEFPVRQRVDATNRHRYLYAMRFATVIAIRARPPSRARTTLRKCLRRIATPACVDGPGRGLSSFGKVLLMNPARHHQHQRNTTPIFRLRLYNGLSIGPVALKCLWSTAMGSEDVGVARDVQTNLGATTYFVSAPTMPRDVASVEIRLRELLQRRLSAAHIQLVRLP